MTRISVNEDVIVAEVHGTPTERLLRLCHRKLWKAVTASGSGRVLYDTRAMDIPSVDVALAQRSLDERYGGSLRRAIVVPNTRIGYLAGLAFAGRGDYRVFYDDVARALGWLRQHP